MQSIDERDRQGTTQLIRACISQNLEEVKSLLQQGANLDIRDNRRHTALHRTCISGNVEIAKILIDSDAKLNRMTTNQHTPLMLCAIHRRIEIAKLLVEKGAEDMKNDKNKTAANYAIENLAKEMFQYLYEKFPARTIGSYDKSLSQEFIRLVWDIQSFRKELWPFLTKSPSNFDLIREFLSFPENRSEMTLLLK